MHSYPRDIAPLGSTPHPPLDPWAAELLDHLQRRLPTSQATHARTLAARPARTAPWPGWVLPALRAALDERGVSQLYTHQVECASAAWEGHHVVVATGTSSGKSLGYQLPVLSALADGRSTALYLTPTKALGSDQLVGLTRLCDAAGLSDVVPAAYDGDTPAELRSAIRQQARLILSNPDMLHSGMLAGHQRFARFFRRLRYVVVDECHSYRGVFGAHVALVLRRLRRVAALYGADPVFILASATATDPAAHAAQLIGEPSSESIVEVTNDGSPAGARTVVLWEPGSWDEENPNSRRAATTEAADLMAALVEQGARTLCFVRSRHSAETAALRAQETLSVAGRGAESRRVASYRAGYLAEDRRRVESQLETGELLGVSTTNALELGIDVGGLDAVVTAGYPGSVASFWQQAGRAGRRGQSSLVVFVARDEPLDTYLVHQPEALLGTPVERAIFNPYNPYVLREHLVCAALEAPLSAADLAAFRAAHTVEELVAAGLLRRRPDGRFYPTAHAAEFAHGQVNLRGGVGQEVLIVDTTDGRLLGTVPAGRAPATVYPGAVYLHQGESYVIDELDLDEGVAFTHPEDTEYSTYARSTTQVHLLGEPLAQKVLAPGVRLYSAEVEVTSQVVGYVVQAPGGKVVSHMPLSMPESSLRTHAVAYTIDPTVLDAMGLDPAQIPGALHAAEHAAIGLLPLIATCDRWDIGGLSTNLHPDTLLPTVFVYDGHPGGAGFAAEGYQRFRTWMEATLHAVSTCTCTDGCPSCVQSPKCGNGNNPLDKQGAITVLAALVAMLQDPPAAAAG